MNEETYILRPVGRVKQEKKRTLLVLHKEYKAAIKGLDEFSHAWILWWFDQNDDMEKRSVLQVHPRGNKRIPLTGVFACRAPVRPNLVGLSLCRILSIKDSVITVEHLNALDNTPILDIKPYMPDSDSANASVADWLNRW